MEAVNPLIVLSMAGTVAIEIAAPFVLAVALVRRYGVGWRTFGVGALVFLLFQVVTRIPAMVYLQTRPGVREALEDPLFLWGFLAFAAFTAGLFEESGRWLAFRFAIEPHQRRVGPALMLGAGHGGLESIGVGLTVAASLATYLILVLMPAGTLPLSAEQLEAVQRQFSGMVGWEPLLGAWERMCTLAIQLALSVAVLLSFQRRFRWWLYALVAHTLVDFSAVGLRQIALDPLGETGAIVAVEVLVGLFAVAALLFIRWVWRTDSATSEQH